jgi:hypothetical protein
VNSAAYLTLRQLLAFYSLSLVVSGFLIARGL